MINLDFDTPLALLQTQIYVEAVFIQFWATAKIALIVHGVGSGARFVLGYRFTCRKTHQL